MPSQSLFRKCAPDPDAQPPAYGEPVCLDCGEPIVFTEGEWVPLWRYRYNALGREATIIDSSGAKVTGELMSWGSVAAVVRVGPDEDCPRSVQVTGDPTNVVLR